MLNIFSSDYFDKSLHNTQLNKSVNIQLSNESFRQDAVMESIDSLVPVKEFGLQEEIRKLFKRNPLLNRNGIADHPDFKDLEHSGLTKKQYTCTIFLDIKGSTRLSLFYELDFIFKFKNAVIQTCIETIRAFDGYVHRIMGDAVLGFFGSSSISKEQAILDALNCCITLRLILEKSIKPWLEKEKKGFDVNDFGFRIGCNFGNDDEILWGNYGFGKTGEISPTGLPVDLAAKLQNLAKKNNIMIGQGLIDFIDFPEEFSQVKTIQKNHIEEKCPYIEPNYITNNGNPLNYKMRILDYDKCLRLLPFDTSFKAEVLHIPNIRHNNKNAIKFECLYQDKVTNTDKPYVSNSIFLEKGIDLKFKITVTNRSSIEFPLTITLKKQNTGIEAVRANYLCDEYSYILKKNITSKYSGSDPLYTEYIQNETTLYRGIHTMTCEIHDKGGRFIFSDIISVWIK